MPKLVFLGTGPALPTKVDLRHDSSTWISYGNDCNILVDCGEGAKYNLLRADLTRKIQHIFLTHDHYDHIMRLTGLFALESWLGRQKRFVVRIYGPEAALERAKMLSELVRSRANAELSVDLDFCPLADGQELSLERVHLTAFATSHREKTSLGYLFTEASSSAHKIVCTGDTRYISSLVDVSRNTNWLIVNANFAGDQLEIAEHNGHMTVTQAAQLAHAANVQQLFLQHLSARNAQRQDEILFEARKIFAATYWAKDLEQLITPNL